MQLDQTVIVTVQEIAFVFRYPVQRGDSFVRIYCGGSERSNSPNMNMDNKNSVLLMLH